jgi:hypothetical protein
MHKYIQDSIREILFRVWDPLGVNDLAPDDEYDSYVAGVFQLLIANASGTEIAEHLRQIEIRKMGNVSNPENRKRVATLLKRLDVS